MTAKQVCDRWFATQRIEEGLYLITEPHYYWYNRANLWLIKGRDRDLLIDTGLGVASLRHHISALIDKPLLAIASHIHFDHAGGIHEFDRRTSLQQYSRLYSYLRTLTKAADINCLSWALSIVWTGKVPTDFRRISRSTTAAWMSLRSSWQT